MKKAPRPGFDESTSIWADDHETEPIECPTCAGSTPAHPCVAHMDIDGLFPAGSDGPSGRSGADLAPLLTFRELSAWLRKSEAQIRRLIDAGALPRPIHIGRTPVWARQDVSLWLEMKLARNRREEPGR